MRREKPKFLRKEKYPIPNHNPRVGGSNPSIATLKKPFDVGVHRIKGLFLCTARSSTKPRRKQDAEHLVIHANPEWTANHWEHDPQEVAQAMLAEFRRVSGLSQVGHNHLQSHR